MKNKKKWVLPAVIGCVLILLVAGIVFFIGRGMTNKESAYANSLEDDDDDDAAVVLEEPPTLTVVSGETSAAALLGTYSWTRANPDGTASSTESDSPHPLNCKDLLHELDTRESTVRLDFAEPPDRILSARCWSDENWSDVEAAAEDVGFDGFDIQLKQGGYIYEVEAEWDMDNGFGGKARYSFYIDCRR